MCVLFFLPFPPLTTPVERERKDEKKEEEEEEAGREKWRAGRARKRKRATHYAIRAVRVRLPFFVPSSSSFPSSSSSSSVSQCAVPAAIYVGQSHGGGAAAKLRRPLKSTPPK